MLRSASRSGIRTIVPRMISFKLKYRFWNTAPTGERQVYTYTELITDVGIEEYINDRLIDSRPNPLGVIPVAYEPNIGVPGSPWGLPDIDSVIPLNRELNEKALEVSDIINYHAAPLTVVVGAKLANIEKGASRVITLPKEASMTNLQGLVELNGPLAYMDYIKRAMHEMTGVPEQALGQMQPISNTSGVALHIQYQPLMNRYDRKTTKLSKLFRKINELVILTLAQKEPAVLQYDPMESAAPEPGHPLVLDPADPNTYETSIHWPPPLPVDVLVKLNEIQAKMGLGLESKEGALRDLGEDMPREKLDEIAAEQVEDAKDAGALSMLTSAIAAAVQLVTGVIPGDPEGGIVPPGGEVTSTAPQGPSLPDRWSHQRSRPWPPISSTGPTEGSWPSTATQRTPGLTRSTRSHRTSTTMSNVDPNSITVETPPANVEPPVVAGETGDGFIAGVQQPEITRRRTGQGPDSDAAGAQRRPAVHRRRPRSCSGAGEVQALQSAAVDGAAVRQRLAAERQAALEAAAAAEQTAEERARRRSWRRWTSAPGWRRWRRRPSSGSSSWRRTARRPRRCWSRSASSAPWRPTAPRS